MAKLIKQKFLQGIDSSKFEIAQNGALMARDSTGALVEILKLSPQDQALLMGVPVATSAELAAVAADLAQEILDRQADVDAEQARAEAAEASISASVAAEVSRATAAEGQIASDLASEVSRATAAESALDGRLDVVEAELPLKAAITYVDAQDASTLQSGKDYTDQKISDLINGAPAMLDTLKEIADQLADDQSVVSALTNMVSGIEADLTAEVARAEAAEAAIAADLAAEVTNRIADVDAEESRAIAAEAQIASDLAGEVVRATAAEGQIASDLAAEVVARDAEDQTFLKLDGSRPMTGDLQMADHSIVLGNPADAGLVLNKGIDYAVPGLVHYPQGSVTNPNNNIKLYGDSYSPYMELNNGSAYMYTQAASDQAGIWAGRDGSAYFSLTVDEFAAGNGRVPGAILKAPGQTLSLDATRVFIYTGVGITDGLVLRAPELSTPNVSQAYGRIYAQNSAGVNALHIEANSELKLGAGGSGATIWMQSTVDMRSNELYNLPAPQYGSSAATKDYVDSASSSASSALSAEIARATAAEAQIASDLAAEVSRATAAEGVIASDLAAEVSRAQSEEARIEAKLDAITWKAHYVALVGAQAITDQHIDLPDLIVPGSLFLSTDLVNWYEGVHFTVSTVAGKTRISFIGDMATGGQCAIESDDDLYAKYQYLA